MRIDEPGLHGGCRVVIDPLRSRPGAAPVRPVLRIAADGISHMELEDIPEGSEAQLVGGDRRLPFAPISGIDLLDLLERLGWPDQPGAAPVHLTVDSGEGGFRSSAFGYLDPFELAQTLRTHCAVRFLYAGVPDICIDQMLSARERVMAQVQGLLDACSEDSKALDKGLADCRAASARAAEIRRRLGRFAEALAPRGAGERHGPRGGSDLERLEAWSKDHRAAVESVARLDEIRKRLEKAETRLAELQAESDRLRTRREDDLRRTAALEQPGGLLRDELHALIGGLVGPVPCGQIRVSVDALGAVGLSGSMPNREALETVRRRFGDIEPYLAGSSFAVGIEAGERCRLPLGEHWLVVAGDDGRPVRVTSIDGLVRRDDLPYPDELIGITPAALEDAMFAPHFAADNTPLVWCRNGKRIGVCKRDGDSDRWSFRGNSERTYAAFPVSLTGRPE